MTPHFITTLKGIVILLLLFSISCKKDIANKVLIKGKILSQVTNQGVPNGKIIVQVYKTEKGWFNTYYNVLIDSVWVSTDINGNFSAMLKYSNENNLGISFYKIDDTISTEFLNSKTRFLLTDFLKDTTPIFYVRKWEKLNIEVKSILPFNDNDACELSFYMEGSNLIYMPVDTIINFGVKTTPLPYPAYYDGKYPYWIGENVNSIVYMRMQEGTRFVISWDVRRNKINTDYNSGFIPTQSSIINEYKINY